MNARTNLAAVVAIALIESKHRHVQGEAQREYLFRPHDNVVPRHCGASCSPSNGRSVRDGYDEFAHARPPPNLGRALQFETSRSQASGGRFAYAAVDGDVRTQSVVTG